MTDEYPCGDSQPCDTCQGETYNSSGECDECLERSFG